MPRSVTMILKAIVSAVIAITLLSLFCLIFNEPGIRLPDPLGTVDYKRPAYEFVAKMNEGYSWFISDANGFNNDEVINDPDILFMGDSQFDATMMLRSQNCASLTAEYTGMRVYNISAPAHLLVKTANNLDNALNLYKPRYVVLITAMLTPNEADMRAVIDRTMKRIVPQASDGIMSYIKRIPCVQPIYFSLESWLKLSDNDETKGTVGTDYNDILSDFLGYIGDISKKHGTQPIIIFHTRGTLDRQGAYTVDYDLSEYSTFSKLCEQNGIGFIDMSDSFIEMYENEHKLPNGFSNTQVNSGHMNADAHNAIALRVAEYIKSFNDTE